MNSELSRRMLFTSADNTLLNLHNSSYPTQPHSLIANYPICCIFCLVVPMFLKGWCGQPRNFTHFQDTNSALGLSALPDARDRLVI